MSILIKGMEMPETCDKCRFQSVLRLYCDAMPYNFCGNTDDIERPDWCPLIEVPPHGRLIDADKIDYRNDAMHDGTGHLVVADNFMNGVLWINDCIDNAPTVIEGEE